MPLRDSSPESKRRILHLGASRQLGNLRSWILELAGFEVIISTSKQLARRLETGKFDCLILGHSIKTDACKRLAEEFKRQNPRSPIIAVVENAWTRYSFPVDNYVCGADGPAALVDAIRSCCETAGDDASSNVKAE
jgi:hypothetical protein